MADAPRSVADYVRAELALRRLSQQTLAETLGENPTWLWRRLSGDVEFSVTEIQRVAEALGVPVSRLFGEPAAEGPTPEAQAS